MKELKRSWWVILFALVCGMTYERTLYKQTSSYQKMQKQLAALEIEKMEAVVLQKKLQQQINSQSDPDWIELTLMKGLGLVPEGQLKVFFE